MKKKYQMRPADRAKFPDAVTLVNGVAVALGGKEIVLNKPGTKLSPPSVRKVRPATQAEMKFLFEEEKHPFIEEIED